MTEIIGLAEAWNAGFIDTEEWEMNPRDYLWASELGNSPIDTFLRLRGQKPTNPPNDRAKRKMGAGVDWEHQIKRIFKRAGILLEEQKYAVHQYPGLLKVTGKLDFLIGGKCDIDAATKYIESNDDLSPNSKRAAMNAIRYYQKTYPDGFAPHPIELKSISDYAMDEMEKSKSPVERNAMQMFHYLISLDFKVGTLSYLNRNDCRMMEFPITNPSAIGETYKKKIELLSKYILSGQEPPKEKLIVFDEYLGKFTKNLSVSWSNYLTMLYGFKEPREYDEPFGKKAANWNRVMKRVKEGAKMTDKNKEVLAEIEKEFDLGDVTSKFRVAAEENEEEA